MMKQVWNFIVLGIVCSFLISTGVMSQDSNQVLDVVKEATTVTNTNENLIVKYTGADPDFDIYNSELQKDVVMQVIAQVTSRLKFCSQPPDMVLAMGAGEAFLAGEIAEYAEAERLKKQMEEVLASTETNDKQIEHLLKLKQSYIDVLAAADRKQNLRNLSSIAFKNAAAVATSEAVEDETYANSCRDYNLAMTNRGKKQGDDFYVLKIACAASMWATCYTMTGGWACPVAVACTAAALLGQSNGNSCQYGGASTANHIIDRQEACDKLGTEDMFNTANNPTMTASKTIRDRCLATGDVVLSGVGNGCSNHSSDGAGPYTPCDQASDAYKRNMVQCSLDVLKEGETANLADAGVSSLIGRKFVLDASVKISRALDLRMASPRQRLIVWEAFSNLAEAASNTNKDMIVAIKAQLDKLQKIIEDLEKISKGIKTNNASDVTFKNNSAEFNSGNSATIQNSDAIALKNKIACITTSIEGACLSPADALLKMDSYNNLSSNLQDPTQQVAKGYNSFTGRSSLSSSELTSAGRLTNNQLKAISDELLKKKKLLQALSAKSGKAWDPKLEASQFKSSLNSAFSNAIKNSGLTAKQLNASSSNQLASNAVNDKTGSDANSAAKLKSFNSNILNGENSNGFFGTKSSNTGGVKKDSSDSKADEVQNSQAQNDANNARLLTESIEARNKANESKYSSSQENTLFENITNAYIRNYDKLLTRKVIKLEK